jgi:hypothetical protein
MSDNNNKTRYAAEVYWKCPSCHHLAVRFEHTESTFRLLGILCHINGGRRV